jgi:hypothetical protein
VDAVGVNAALTITVVAFGLEVTVPRAAILAPKTFHPGLIVVLAGIVSVVPALAEPAVVAEFATAIRGGSNTYLAPALIKALAAVFRVIMIV